MKKIILTLLAAGSMHYLNAQTIVSTTPENKKVLVEEFTGTGCPNCPGGHIAAETLLNNNPGNLFVIAYHPTNSSYTTTDPMKRVYPDPFYTMPFISPTGRYMPSAMINRRVWGGIERIQTTGTWTTDGNTVKSEPSPLNVGVSSTYNSSTKIIDVTVEVYFTADVTDALTIFAELSEDGIIYPQSGGTSPYTHNHVFRESFVSQWGDAISTPTTQSTLKTFTFSFDNTTANYDMTKCEVVAFVRNAANEEIISANGIAVDHATAISSNVKVENSVRVFPNPINESSRINISLSASEKVNYSLINMVGQEVVSNDLGILTGGNHVIGIDKSAQLQKGIYFLKVKIGQNNISQKLIVE